MTLIPKELAAADHVRHLAREYHEAKQSEQAARKALYDELGRLHPGLSYSQLEHLCGLSSHRIRQVVEAYRIEKGLKPPRHQPPE